MTDQITTTLVIFGAIFRYVLWALMEDQLYTSVLQPVVPSTRCMICL